MAAIGTVTLNVEVGGDLEAAIRKIVRDEIANIAQNAADSEANCTTLDCQAWVPLATLTDAARSANH